jgi:hypothetical protein
MWSRHQLAYGIDVQGNQLHDSLSDLIQKFCIGQWTWQQDAHNFGALTRWCKQWRKAQ